MKVCSVKAQLIALWAVFSANVKRNFQVDNYVSAVDLPTLIKAFRDPTPRHSLLIV